MFKRSWIPGVLGALALTVLIADGASANSRLGRARANDPSTPESFSLSTEYTGSLVGDIRIGGRTYRLAPGAVCYELGAGVIRPETVLANRQVFVTGWLRNDVGLIQMVVVRPARGLWDERQTGSPTIRTRPADAPQ